MSASTTTEDTPTPEPISPAKRFFRIAGLITLFIACLLIFTLAKLPETKMTSLIQGYVQAALDPYGAYITDQGREFSVLHGFRYTLIKPTIELSDMTRIEFDELVVSPKLLSILMFKPGATIQIKQGPSTIFLDGAGRGDQIAARVKLDQVSIGKLGILNYLAQIKGGGFISGEMNISGALSDPKSLTGKADFTLKSIQIDEQNLMGFQLENMKIADGAIDLVIEQGKVTAKNFKLGKPNSSDDLNVQVTGDITLNRYLNASMLNLRAVLGLSDRVKQKLSLLDSLMATAKQSDGRYAYKLTGPMNAPFPNPDPDKK